MNAIRTSTGRDVGAIVDQDARRTLSGDRYNGGRKFKENLDGQVLLSKLDQLNAGGDGRGNLLQDVLKLFTVRRGRFSGCAAGNQIKDRL
jgi:hypothetical protein